MTGPPMLTPPVTNTRSVLPAHTYGTLKRASPARHVAPANCRAKPASECDRSYHLLRASAKEKGRGRMEIRMWMLCERPRGRSRPPEVGLI